MTKTLKAYISGALSSAPGKVRLEILYDKIGELCEKKGISAFIPLRDANFNKIPGYSHKKLYESNMEKIKETDLLIAYVGLPSIGVGMEVQEAKTLGKDVILMTESGLPISKPLMGCPAVVELICFKDFESGLKLLDTALDRWLSEK